jgi:ubiquitin carboxyl-terminal hydrolase 36/42
MDREFKPKINGLNNLGNTCFFNSVLQILYQCTILNKIIYNNTITGNLIDQYNLYLNSYNEHNSSFSPEYIINYVSTILGRNGYQQEDAEQYLNFIIDALIDELKLWTKKEGKGSTIIKGSITLDILIDSLFTIKMNKEIICPDCKTISKSSDDINKLYLTLNDESDDLENMIINYYTEKLDNENKYKCSSCKNHVEATINRNIIKLPKYLIIALKRYTNNNDKINKRINIQESITFNSPNKIYNLRGFIYHSGNTGGGHYVYYGKKDNVWHEYNDSHVSVVNNIENIVELGYIYLYVS